MSEETDPQKIQKELLEAIRKMMDQVDVVKIEPVPEKAPADEGEKKKKDRSERLHFTLKPRDVKKHLDRFVIKQEEAKRVLATAVCDHYHHVSRCDNPERCREYMKQNVIMIGPTGVGKTYLIRSLSDLIGVPFTKADATKFSETGYVGGDVEDLVRDLVHRADGDIGLGECGIVYLDEVDKIASASNLQGRDVSGTGVQRGLLKIMEETEVPLRNPQDMHSQIQAVMEFQQKGKITRPVINTRHILFIVSGAFDRLPAIVEKRMRSAHIGFTAGRPSVPEREEVLRQARTEDFIEFGFEPEFIGRLPVRVVCDPLTAEDLYTILKTSEGSILKQYRAAFEAYGIRFRADDAALWEIAKKAAAEGTGARGLATVCERVMRDAKYELPSTGAREFHLKAEAVHGPREALRGLLREEREKREREIEGEMRAFERGFAEKNGIAIRFDGAAVRAAQQRILDEELDTASFLERLLSNYAPGLALIQKKNPGREFVLPEEAIRNPNGLLEAWIKESYEAGA